MPFVLLGYRGRHLQSLVFAGSLLTVRAATQISLVSEAQSVVRGEGSQVIRVGPGVRIALYLQSILSGESKTFKQPFCSDHLQSC